MLCVKVAPVSDGWAVTCGAVENLMLFRSGAQAEDAARRLAQALAEAGEWAEIEVRMRDGARAARFICTPQGSDREGAQAAVQRLQMA